MCIRDRHNIAGINSLCEILRNSGEERFVGLIGMVKGKAYEYAAEKLSEIFEYVFCAEGFIENNIPVSYTHLAQKPRKKQRLSYI